MGVILETAAGEGLYGHEGYAGRVLEDGSVSGTWSDDTERHTVGWRPACSCGWSGRMSDCTDREQPSSAQEDQMIAEWTAEHARPLLAELELRGLAQGAEAAAAALREGVRRSRDAGVSWEQIGRAIGVSRQAAWERFASA